MTPIHWKVLECIVLKAGFVFKKQRGDHRRYGKKGALRPVIIPTYREIDLDIIKSNLKTAGISRDEYFKLLKDC